MNPMKAARCKAAIERLETTVSSYQSLLPSLRDEKERAVLQRKISGHLFTIEKTKAKF